MTDRDQEQRETTPIPEDQYPDDQPQYQPASPSPDPTPEPTPTEADAILSEPGAPEPVFTEPPSSEPILGEPMVSEQVETAAVQTAAVTPEEVAAATPAPSIRDVIASRDRQALAELTERGARILLAIGIFLVPVAFDPRTIDAFNLTKMTALWIFGILSLSAWLASTILGGGPRSLPRSRIIRGSLVLLGITLVSTLLSPSRTLSFHGLYHRYEGLASLVLYIGVLLLIVLLYWRRPQAVRELSVAIGAAGAVASVYILLQAMGIDIVQWRQLSGRELTAPIGTIGNSGFAASFLGIAAPFVVHLALSARQFSRTIVWSGSGVVLLIALWLTEGRSGLIAALCGILAFVLFTSRVKTMRKVALIALTLVALGLMPLVAGDWTDRSQEGLFRRGSAGYRVQVWDASWRMFANRPILGWGPESFFGQYSRFRTPAEARTLALSLTDKPHNIFLGWATATGIAGLAAYVFVVMSGITLAARFGARLKGTQRLLAAAFGAGLVAYLVQGLYSVDVPPLALMGWVCLGGIAVLVERFRGTRDAAAEGSVAAEQPQPAPIEGGAIDQPPTTRARETQLLGPRTPTILGGVGAVVALALLILGFSPLRADHAAWAAERRAQAGWSPDTMELYEKAIGLDPREAAYRGLAAAYLERIAQDKSIPFSPETALRRSAALNEEAINLQPRNVYFMLNASRVYARLGESVDVEFFNAGEKWLGQAVSLDPLDPQMHDLYSDLLRRWSNSLGGRVKRETLQRSQTQAGIAQALRQGRVIR